MWKCFLSSMPAVVLALLIGVVVIPANADESKSLFRGTTVEMDPHGGVMCIWMIYVSQKALAENCHRERDAAYIEALDWSLRELEKFIIRNSKTTAEDLLRGREHFVRGLMESVTIIDRTGVCAYTSDLYPPRDKMPNRQEMEAGIHELLSIERTPSWNPCL